MKWIRIGPNQIVNLELVVVVIPRDCQSEGRKFPFKIDFCFTADNPVSRAFKMSHNRKDALYKVFEFLNSDEKFLDLWEVDLPDEDR